MRRPGGSRRVPWSNQVPAGHAGGTPSGPRGPIVLPWGLRVEIEHRLSDVLSEFARTLMTDFPIQAILDHLVVRIVDVLPISAAGRHADRAGRRPPLRRRLRRVRPALRAAADRPGRGPVPRGVRDRTRPSPCPTCGSTTGSRCSRRGPWRPGWSRCSPSRSAMATAARRPGPLPRHRRAARPGAMAAAQTLADVAAAYLINAQARVDLRGVRRSASSRGPCTTRSPGCRTGRCSSSASSTRSLRCRRSRQDGGDAVRRPRPVQGGQRHLRPPGRATSC